MVGKVEIQSLDPFWKGRAMTDTKTPPPLTKVKPISDWGPECARGFVRDARFGPGQVIPGTSRAKTRKNIRLNTWEGAK